MLVKLTQDQQKNESPMTLKEDDDYWVNSLIVFFPIAIVSHTLMSYAGFLFDQKNLLYLLETCPCCPTIMR
jgi:hypothetical protein